VDECKPLDLGAIAVEVEVEAGRKEFDRSAASMKSAKDTQRAKLDGKQSQQKAALAVKLAKARARRTGRGVGAGRIGLSQTPLCSHWSCTNQVHTDMVT